MRRTILAVICVSLFLAGCAHEVVRVNSGDDGRVIALRKGQDMVVRLEGNPTTGYIWEITDINKSMIEISGEDGFEPESTLVGAGGVQVFKFRAVSAGNTALSFVYHRPWETNVEPLRTFSIKITVR